VKTRNPVSCAIQCDSPPPYNALSCKYRHALFRLSNIWCGSALQNVKNFVAEKQNDLCKYAVQLAQMHLNFLSVFCFVSCWRDGLISRIWHSYFVVESVVFRVIRCYFVESDIVTVPWPACDMLYVFSVLKTECQCRQSDLFRSMSRGVDPQ